MVSAKSLGLQLALLTLVFVIVGYVTAENADVAAAETFSVSASGKINKDGGSPFAIYYCAGSACPNADQDGYPGFYAVVAHQHDGTTFLTEHSVEHTFSWNAAGELTCTSLPQPMSGDDISAMVSDFQAAVAASNGGDVSIGGHTFTINANDISYDLDPSDDDTSLFGRSVPDASECNTNVGKHNPGVNTPELVDSLNPNGGGRALWAREGRKLAAGRKLWSTTSFGNKEAWMVSQSYYRAPLENSAHSGWTRWVECSNDNTGAAFFYRNSNPMMTLRFEGTSGFTAFSDWYDNLDTAMTTCAGGREKNGNVHHVENSNACIQQHVDLLHSWGIPVQYVVGHSLGGATATTYSKCFSGARRGRAAAGDIPVRSFGPNPTSGDGSCQQPGVRHSHEKDAISSNVMGYMGSFSHNTASAKQPYDESYCSSDCWAGCCPWGWSSRKRVRNAGCSAKSGGCSWLADCAYYFATAHGNYGQYL